MRRHDILTAKWLIPVNSILFPASHLFNLPKYLYGPHTQLYLLLLLSPAKQPIFHPPDYLIPFDFGRPFFLQNQLFHHRSSAPHKPNPPTTPPIINTIKMRFSVVAAAVMATAVSAGEAVYYSTTVSSARPLGKSQTNQYQSTTDVVTITSCGPEVTNCPGKTYTSTLANSTSYPVYANTSAPVTTSTYVAVPTYPSYPVSVPVSLATSYITTCVPTVITKVYTVTPTPVVPVASTGYITYPHNAT
jgi:hypothetical protein